MVFNYCKNFSALAQAIKKFYLGGLFGGYPPNELNQNSVKFCFFFIPTYPENFIKLASTVLKFKILEDPFKGKS